MKKIILLVSFLISGSLQAHEALDTMRQVLERHNQRFSADHKFINDFSLNSKFSDFQNSAIRKLRNNGNILKSIRVTNNIKSDLVINVSLIQERNGLFVGLIVERSRYNSKLEESYLKFYSFWGLNKGEELYSYNNVSVVTIQSVNLKVEDGGRMTIKYPTNFKNNSFDELKFDIVKNEDGVFDFLSLEKRWIKQISLKAWLRLFSLNFGIEKLELN